MTIQRAWCDVVLAASICCVAATGCRTLPNAPNSTPISSAASNQAANTQRLDMEVMRASTADLKPTPNGSVQLHLDLAKALDSQGQLERANEEYQKAINAARAGNLRTGSREERARLNRRLGAAYDRLGDPKTAQTHYQEAQKLAPNDPSAWNDSGYSAYLQGRWADAERDFRKALALDRSNPRAATNLGMTLAASGRVDEALELLTPINGAAAAHANVAYVLAAAGKPVEARTHYQQALAADPKLVTATRGLTALDTAELAARTVPIAKTH